MRRREKVDLPLLAGPHTRTTGGGMSEEMRAAAEAQSGGTRTSGACSGAGGTGLGMGLGTGHGAWVAGDAGGGGDSGCFFIDRRRFPIAAPLDECGTEGPGGMVLRRGGEETAAAAVAVAVGSGEPSRDCGREEKLAQRNGHAK
jgi:hypothetical protein